MENNFFYFTKSERTGVVVLLLLCVLCLLLPQFWPDRSQSNPADFSALQTQMAAWQITTAEVNENPSFTSNGSASTETSQTATPFDPNQPTEALLAAAGLSKRAQRAWLSYINKGGQFNHWTDVEKFRALSDQEREQLRPLLQFASTNTDASTAIATRDEAPVAEIILENFDPNTVTEAQLQSYGLEPKTARGWTRYLAAGGRFRTADDLQKLYSLSAEDFTRLQPYVSIPVQEKAPLAAADSPTFYDAPANVVININTATAEDWQQLRGIGSGYSRRIINFRDKLGGFHSVAQVAETYGLPDSVFQRIQLQLRPGPLVRQLNINTATEEELAAHPYLRYSDARAIVNYRKQHGSYGAPSEIEKLYALNAETKAKILPYLVVE